MIMCLYVADMLIMSDNNCMVKYTYNISNRDFDIKYIGLVNVILRVYLHESPMRLSWNGHKSLEILDKLGNDDSICHIGVRRCLSKNCRK